MNKILSNKIIDIVINSIVYLQIFFSYFFYSESNNYYFFGKYSSRKLKELFRYVILVKENEILKKLTLFSYKNNYKKIYSKKNETILESNKRIFFKGSLYEYKGKIKIIGRGWKIIKFPYELLIKLGYSHPIFVTLDPFLTYKLKKKKKKYYIFYSTWYNKVNTLMSRFYLMRIPDIYTRKGIFQRKVIL
jgi:hypothetical protein